LWQAVQDAAVAAATRDYRFRNVTADELPELALTISVLTPPEPIAGREDIVLGRHGIVLHKDGRSATFLPQVASEQGWDLEQTLTQLSLKAGLPADAWRAGAVLLVFEAEVFAAGVEDDTA
jgi:AmmeMemoRadiSam system protein A